MKYSSAIEYASLHANPIYLYRGSFISTTISEEQMPITIPLEGEHDFPIAYPSRDAIKTPACDVHVDTLQELEEVLHEYYAQHDTPVDEGVTRLIQSELIHEEQHAKLATGLGALSVIYGMRLHRHPLYDAPSWQAFCKIADWKTTKLGSALFDVYPENPSPQDKQRAYSKGYGDLLEIATAANERDMPLPLSIQRIHTS